MSRHRHPYLRASGPIALAHRGGDLDGLENSLAAFTRAVELGYRWLETDLHATADGVLVAFHDDTLDRSTDRRGPIATQSWDAVSQARIGGREPIPRLDELLEAWPAIRWNLDAKEDAVVGPLVEVLRRPGVTERVCVGSFDDGRLTTLRRAVGPGLCTSAAPGEVRRLRIASWLGVLGRCVPVGADCLQIPIEHDGHRLVDARMVAHAHGRGMPVHVWTVNGAAEMERLLDLGVDGIITDRLELAREVLRRRGDWPPQ